MALNKSFRVKDSLYVGTSGFFAGTAVSIDTSGKILSAEVLEYNQAENYIVVSHISTSDGTYGTFVPGIITNTRLRNISGALAFLGDSERSVSRTLISIDENVYGDSSFAQNDIFDTTENSFDLDFLDFSENNPFGDPEDL